MLGYEKKRIRACISHRKLKNKCIPPKHFTQKHKKLLHVQDDIRICDWFNKKRRGDIITVQPFTDANDKNEEASETFWNMSGVDASNPFLDSTELEVRVASFSHQQEYEVFKDIKDDVLSSGPLRIVWQRL